MSNIVHDRLNERGIILPQPAAPVANYLSFAFSGNILYISGQLPIKEDKMIKGCLGQNLTVEEGAEAAKYCAVNILAQVNIALGGEFSCLVRCVKLGGFISSTADFLDHPKVMNGASDLMVAVLGDAGRHTRFAVGAPSLPLGAAVEIDALFEVK